MGGQIVWNPIDVSSVCGSHEFAFLQPESQRPRKKCFFGKYVLVDLPSLHVHIAHLNAAGCECHFDVNLGNIAWPPGRQPGSRRVDFIA